MNKIIFLFPLLFIFVTSNLFCPLCKNIITNINDILQKNKTKDSIDYVALDICKYLESGKNCKRPIYSKECDELCKGVVNLHSNEVIVLLNNIY